MIIIINININIMKEGMNIICLPSKEDHLCCIQLALRAFHDLAKTCPLIKPLTDSPISALMAKMDPLNSRLERVREEA